MFAQCLDRKEQSAGDVALGVFLLGTDIDDGQLVAKRVCRASAGASAPVCGSSAAGEWPYAANMKM